MNYFYSLEQYQSIMETTSYRKNNINNPPILLMRQLYYDYERHLFRRRKRNQIQAIQNTPKTSSTMDFNKIIKKLSHNENLIQQFQQHIVHKKQISKRSNFLRTKSRRQLEEMNQNKKGEFKNSFSKTNGFFKKNLCIKEQKIKKQNLQLMDSIVLGNQKENEGILAPLQRRNNLNNLKQKLNKFKIAKKQISATLRFNYILSNRYRKDSSQELCLTTRKAGRDDFYKTKQNIFPTQ